MLHIKRILITGLFFAVGLGFGAGIANIFRVTAQEASFATFEEFPCAFEIPEGETIRCGFVSVPENRETDETNTIRLAVVVVEGAQGAPADPVMILSGGPGEKTVMNAAAFLGTSFRELAGERDLIMFDQRGVGMSEPALECPEWVQAQFDSLSLEPTPENMEVALQTGQTALLGCRDRYLEEGIDLAGYNTVQNAADVVDIVQALGYDQVNLVGVSYGSLLAQSVMRDHPEIIRSVVIDSVLPTTRSLFLESTTTAFEALERLIAACAADESCNAAYPALDETLRTMIETLNANPAPVTLVNFLTGETYESYLSGDAALGALLFLLCQKPLLPVMPQAVSDAAAGNLELMTQITSVFLLAFDSLSRGMQYSVACAEDVIGLDGADFMAAYESLAPQYRGMADLEVVIEYGPFGICQSWGVPELDAAVKAPVVSDLPALVLAGEFDPVTPPQFAEEVAASLSNSVQVTIPSAGHSVMISEPCAAGIAAAFIADPAAEPDLSCVSAIPPVPFQTP